MPWKADLPSAATNRLDLVRQTATARIRRRRTRTSDTGRVDVAFVLWEQGWEGCTTDGVRRRRGTSDVGEGEKGE